MTIEKLLLRKCFHRKSTFFALFSVICFVFWILFLSQSYQSTKDFQRKTTYGFHNGTAFDISQASAELIRNHNAVTATGQMLIGGQIIDSDNRNLGYIGAVDKGFCELEQLSFLEGTYPVSGNEIAVEYLLLDQLNIPYELGSQIDIGIVSQDGKTATQSYTLCGIIKSYTTNWKSEDFPLCSAFVANIETVEQQHLFFTGDYENEGQMLELQQLVFGTQRSTLVYNDFSFPEASDLITDIFSNNGIVLVSICVSCLLVSGAFLSGRKQQIYTMRVFLLLGANRKKLFRELLRQSSVQWCKAYVFSVVLCSFTCALLILLANTEGKLVLSIFPYLISGVFSYGCSIVGAASQIQLLRTATILPKGKDLTKYALNAAPHNHRFPMNSVKSFIRIQRKRNAMFFLIEGITSAILALVLFVCLYGICLNVQGDSNANNIAGYDYSWSAHSPDMGLSPSEITQISHTANIETVVYTSRARSSVDGMVYLTYPGQNQDEYLVPNNAMQGFPSYRDGLCVELVVLPNNSLLWDYYMPETVSADDFRQGNCVLLFLPELSVTHQGLYTITNTFEINSSGEIAKTYVSELSEGDTVTLNTESTGKTVQCAHIMRRFAGHSQGVIDFLVPGSVLISETLFCELFKLPAITYNDVFAVGNNRLSYDVGDKLMSKITGNRQINFTNYRIERETSRNVLLTNIITYSCIAILTCLLGVVLLWFNRTRLFLSERSRISLLKNLGCSNHIITASYMWGIEYWLIPFTIILNVFVLVVGAYQRYAAVIAESRFFSFWSMLFQTAYLNFPWMLLILPQVILLCVLIWLYKRKTKNAQK